VNVLTFKARAARGLEADALPVLVLLAPAATLLDRFPWFAANAYRPR
jgi:hypothetical protein